MEIYIMMRKRVRLCSALNVSNGRILHVKEMGGPVSYRQNLSFVISAKSKYLVWENQRKIVPLNESV